MYNRERNHLKCKRLHPGAVFFIAKTLNPIFFAIATRIVEMLDLMEEIDFKATPHNVLVNALQENGSTIYAIKYL